MRAFVDSSSIIAIEGDDSVVVGAADPAYAAVRDYLTVKRGQDFAHIRHLVDTVRVTVKAIAAEALSVVDGETTEDGTTYRVTHGDPVAETVLSTALRLARENADLAPLGAFLSRLERNPSEASRSQLFGWLRASGFTLTTDGLIVGYKSVREDGFSSCAGNEPVTVTHQDGTVETVTGRVPYPVGATVTMPRELVATERSHACSVGLHVGTYGYADTFSEQMLVVLVDPADVVSVPSDCGAQKMRVSKLFVAALHDGEQISDAVLDNIRTVPDFDAIEEYANRLENRRPVIEDDFADDDCGLNDEDLWEEWYDSSGDETFEAYRRRRYAEAESAATAIDDSGDEDDEQSTGTATVIPHRQGALTVVRHYLRRRK